MNFTISAGWWLAPAIFTLIAFITAARAVGKGDEGLGMAVVALFCYGGASIFSLIAWLIWALAS